MATYIVKSNQNLFDVALHLYGSIEGLFDLLISNPELSMASDLAYGQSLEYHESFVLNSSVVNEFEKRNIIPSGGSRKVYHKQPEEDLIFLVPIEPETAFSSFKASGEGQMIIDWGDNSLLEYVNLSLELQTISHYFDNEVETRRIRIYGNAETLKFIRLDTTELAGTLLLCKPITVDEYICHGQGYALTGLALMQGTYKVDLQKGTIANLLSIGDMDLQELNLTEANFVTDNVLDEYLEYIVSHHNDRRPCIMYLTTEPTERGYYAINKILNEPEWNISDSWKFYINGQLYQLENGTDIE